MVCLVCVSSDAAEGALIDRFSCYHVFDLGFDKHRSEISAQFYISGKNTYSEQRGHPDLAPIKRTHKLSNGMLFKLYRRLLPSDTVFLAGWPIAAVLLQYGSLGSHAALFSREIGLPAIAGIPNLITSVPDNAYALVDADRGAVTIRPDVDDKAVFQEKIKTIAEIFEAARVHAQRPAVTKDGVSISVLANVGCREDTEKAMHNGADGVGL